MASSFATPWPDPNSPVLSKIDFGFPLVELFKWLDVRDTFLGTNEREQDITAALVLARECNHPDAVWLTTIFEGKDVLTKEQAREVLRLNQDDARALPFVWYLTDDLGSDWTLLRRSSDMGNAFACSMLCEQLWRGHNEGAFCLARFAAAQHERDGYYWLGRCFREGLGCEKDLNLAKENYTISLELGDVYASTDHAHLLGYSDPVCWLWLGRVALRGLPYSFLDCFSKEVERFFSGSGNAKIMSLIGHSLRGNIDMEKKQIFGSRINFDYCVGPANQAVSFYSSQIKSARLAVDAWTLVSTRLHVIKDLRIFIGKMIWEARFEANYKI